MIKIGIVPVFYHDNFTKASKVLQACYDGGIRCFEFTNRGANALSVFSQLREYTHKNCPGLYLGTGSVIDADTADLFISAGSDFIVSPVYMKETSGFCKQKNIPYIPGCGTLTEIINATKDGAEICKVFPAGEIGGPSFVKSILAPCPWLSIMPTGGVNPEQDSLTKWFKSGVACVGIGSKLFPAAAIENNAFDSIREKVKDCIAYVADFRKNQNKG